jgi:hypothetical protein
MWSIEESKISVSALVIRRKDLELPPVKALLAILSLASFRREMEACTGYDRDDAPYRKSNKRKRNQGGSKPRHYKRHWILERTNTWLGQFLRLQVRHEQLLTTHFAFFYFYFACLWIMLRHCLSNTPMYSCRACRE